MKSPADVTDNETGIIKQIEAIEGHEARKIVRVTVDFFDGNCPAVTFGDVGRAAVKIVVQSADQLPVFRTAVVLSTENTAVLIKLLTDFCEPKSADWGSHSESGSVRKGGVKTPPPPDTDEYIGGKCNPIPQPDRHGIVHRLRRWGSTG